MFFHDRKLQFPVRVERPNPVFAKALQQAIGGVEGEIRVALQYFFQAWARAGRPGIATCCSRPGRRSWPTSRCSRPP
jgi:Mn-containing catalase